MGIDEANGGNSCNSGDGSNGVSILGPYTNISDNELAVVKALLNDNTLILPSNFDSGTAIQSTKVTGLESKLNDSLLSCFEDSCVLPFDLLKEEMLFDGDNKFLARPDFILIEPQEDSFIARACDIKESSGLDLLDSNSQISASNLETLFRNSPFLNSVLQKFGSLKLDDGYYLVPNISTNSDDELVRSYFERNNLKGVISESNASLFLEESNERQLNLNGTYVVKEISSNIFRHELAKYKNQIETRGYMPYSVIVIEGFDSSGNSIPSLNSLAGYQVRSSIPRARILEDKIREIEYMIYGNSDVSIEGLKIDFDSEQRTRYDRILNSIDSLNQRILKIEESLVRRSRGFSASNSGEIHLSKKRKSLLKDYTKLNNSLASLNKTKDELIKVISSQYVDFSKERSEMTWRDKYDEFERLKKKVLLGLNEELLVVNSKLDERTKRDTKLNASLNKYRSSVDPRLSCDKTDMRIYYLNFGKSVLKLIYSPAFEYMN